MTLTVYLKKNNKKYLASDSQINYLGLKNESGTKIIILYLPHAPTQNHHHSPHNLPALLLHSLAIQKQNL